MIAAPAVRSINNTRWRTYLWERIATFFFLRADFITDDDVSVDISKHVFMHKETHIRNAWELLQFEIICR